MSGVLTALLLSCSVAAVEVPRHPRIWRLGVDDGLPNGTVYSIAQDPTGFLWFGTEDGLARFDGYSFGLYPHRPGDPASLAAPQASQVFVDRSGRVWVGTWGGGLERLDLASGRFVHFGAEPAQGVDISRIQRLFEDRAGMLWVSTHSGGLVRFDPETGQFTAFRPVAQDPTTLSHQRVWGVSQDAGGQLWVATSSGLDRLDPVSGETWRLPVRAEDGTGVPHPEVRAVHVDRQGVVWAGTRQGLASFDPRSGSWHQFRHDPQDPYSLSDDVINVFLEDRAGRLWIGTMYGGVSLWDADRQRFVRFRHDQADPSSLSYDDVRAIFEDHSGLLWVATRGEGVNRLDPRTPFVARRRGPQNEGGLSHDRVWTIAQQSPQILWVGTQAGLDRLDLERDHVRHYRHSPGESDGLPAGDVRQLHLDRAGRLWIGGNSGGVHRLADSLGSDAPDRLHLAAHSDWQLDGGVVRGFANGPAGDLWIGATNGIHVLDPATGRRLLRLRQSSRPGLSDERVQALLFDRTGILWIATTQGGLDRFDSADGTIRNFRNDATDPSSLSRNDLLSLHEDRFGRIWVGTLGGGLDCLQPADGTFLHYTSKDGLPSNVVQAIGEDADGNLWIAGNRGLARLSADRRTIRAFDRSDGLRGSTFNRGATLRTPRGRLYFGATDGLHSFDPMDISEGSFGPPVVLTGFQLFGEAVDLGHPMWLMDEVTIRQSDNFFAIEFAALDFTNPEQNLYAYRLHGFDRSWIEAGHRRVAQYTNLDGGEYRFEVRGASHDGTWSDSTASLRIRVVPPFWAASWFRWTALTLLLAFTAGGLRWRWHAAEITRRRLEATVDERTAALTEANRRLEQVSLTDPLTGLRNRRYFYQTIEPDVAQCLREHRVEPSGRRDGGGGSDLVFLMIDLDHFKAINDRCGHSVGDQVLQHIAGLLRTASRRSDVVVRWGGEEFLVFSRFCDRASGPWLAERIRKSVESCPYHLPDGTPLPLTCTIGIAALPFLPGDSAGAVVDVQLVLDLADRALYAAKEAGRNTWVVASASDGATADGLAARLRDQTPETAAHPDLLLRERQEVLLGAGDRPETRPRLA